MSQIRKNVVKTILEASYKANACHIGSALSCVDILIDIYFNRMEPEDIFIFSKASGVAALYAVLAEKGIIPHDKVWRYLKEYPLASSEVPGVIVSTGSLGHGLPIAVGMALGNRNRKVYVLISDGEIDEGTTWESVLFASHHDLEDTLNIIVDKNEYQACGPTDEIIKIDYALRLLKRIFPIQVVETIKGCGIDFMEHDNSWHYRNLTKEELKKALCQI